MKVNVVFSRHGLPAAAAPASRLCPPVEKEQSWDSGSRPDSDPRKSNRCPQADKDHSWDRSSRPDTGPRKNNLCPQADKDQVWNSDGLNVDLRNSNAVVIDVLRATSVMVTALANGARLIIPCLTPEDALQVHADGGGDGLLCGERGGRAIPGFHLGNSPLEFTPEQVGGQTLIITTSNGTKTLLAAAAARRVVVSSLLNSGAAASFLLQDGADLLIVCSGTDGAVSYDDLLGAGSLVHKMAAGNPLVQLSDSAVVVRDLYRLHRQDLLSGLLQANHARFLCQLGMESDLRYCAQEDLLPIVPLYRAGQVTLQP